MLGKKRESHLKVSCTKWWKKKFNPRLTIE